jgi:hypothetical protein
MNCFPLISRYLHQMLRSHIYKDDNFQQLSGLLVFLLCYYEVICMFVSDVRMARHVESSWRLCLPFAETVGFG